MVSLLWDACSEGRLDDVHKLLTNASLPDIEVKDASGITPLIRAIQQGHVEVVRALLDKGADPLNSSNHGPPQQYTTDPAILDLLRSKIPEEKNFMQDIKSFYSPAAPYAYYPSAGAAPPEGAVYYPPPPSTGENGNPGGPGHLPPPDIARLIPCRYFPACRYGTSCMFAHPQGPYFQGSLPPPAQYSAPYDPINPQSYSPSYYPQSFQHQNPSPPPPSMAPPSDSVSSHFSPSAPYPTMMSPSIYAHPGQVAVPMSLPPLQQQPPGAQAQPVVYPAPLPPVSPYPLPQTDSSSYTPVALPSPYTQVNGLASPSPDSPVTRDTSGQRRGTGRRPSTYSRKPPCLFFPAGKCKNGDECRFPHVFPDSTQQVRGNVSRTRVSGNPNGLNGVDEKLAGLSLQGQNGQGSSKFQSSEPGNRTRYTQSKNSQTNGLQQKKPPAAKQRVPNADEFPVLAGSTTPPSGRLALNATSGPTAAQVLQAPAPFKSGAHSPEDLSTNGVSNAPASSKLPLSFAAAATGPAGSDTTKEVPVSA